MIIVAAVLIFLAVALGFAAWQAGRSSAGIRALEQRMRGQLQGGGTVEALDVERDTRYSALPWFDRMLRTLNLGQRLELLLYQAGMGMRAGVLVLLIAVFAIGGYFLAVLFFHRIGPGIIGLIVFAPMPYFYVTYRKHLRMQAFAREFPDALDLLVSALRAGLSFSAAMQIVAEESPDPVRGEFAITVEEQSLGLDFREALVNLTNRVDSLDLRFFVTAVLLQRDTGGNLAEILHNTAMLIRERFRILGDIQTFTAQGRMTGMVLGLLPIGMGVMMFAFAPEYFRPMLDTDGGRTALIIAGVMQLLGALAIRKIVKIRV